MIFIERGDLTRNVAYVEQYAELSEVVDKLWSAGLKVHRDPRLLGRTTVSDNT